MAQVVLNYKHALSAIKAVDLSCFITLKAIQNVFDIIEKTSLKVHFVTSFIVPISFGTVLVTQITNLIFLVSTSNNMTPINTKDPLEPVFYLSLWSVKTWQCTTVNCVRGLAPFADIEDSFKEYTSMNT